MSKKKIHPILKEFLDAVETEGLGYALSDYHPDEDQIDKIGETDPKTAGYLRAAIRAYNQLEEWLDEEFNVGYGY